MSSEVPCSALKTAIGAKGFTYSQIAQSVGTTQERIQDIVTGKERPSQQEFNSIARSLNITSPAPHDSAHATK